MFLGRHALNLVPKRAAGTAAGFTGFFGCVFCSASADTGVGWINRPLKLKRHVRHHGGVLSTAFSDCSLGHPTENGDR